MAHRVQNLPRIVTGLLARFTVEEYHRMLEAGILHDCAPVELLDGLLVHKDRSAVGGDPMTIGERHAMAIGLLGRLDRLVAPAGCHLRTQLPVSLPPLQEPEPDGAVAKGDWRDYPERHPGASDVTCVFEVAESSLEHDRTTKLAIYAGAGIPQYVIVNLVDGRLEVYEEPLPDDGRYVRAAVLGPADTLLLKVGGPVPLHVAARDLLP